jgi:hypothetical protein
MNTDAFTFAGSQQFSTPGMKTADNTLNAAWALPSSCARARRKHGRWRRFTITIGEVTEIGAQQASEEVAAEAKEWDRLAGR